MPKTFTKDEFIVRATAIHNGLYDYSHVTYKNMHTKICIIDPDYGDFWQTPLGHLAGQGHPIRGRLAAAKKRKLGEDEFIRRAREKHGTLYDYSKVVYKHIDKKVCIIDPDYGEFWQSPYQHLNSYGCPARTSTRQWDTHVDHIIPLSIVHPGNRSADKWFKQRPLYKFLDSDINKRKIAATENIKKSDCVLINDKIVYCNSIRNNYDIIHYLIANLLKVDPTEIINSDREFIKTMFGI